MRMLRKLGRKVYYGPKIAIGNLFFKAKDVLNDGERYDPFLSSFSYRDKCHLPRYRFAAKYVSKEDEVLDIACGTGYGTQILGASGKKVSGVDISRSAIDYANKRNKMDNVFFVRNDFFSNAVAADVVVSFETIEHIKVSDISLVLEKLASYTRDKLIGSFPYREKSGGNEYHHLFDLDETSLQCLLNYGEVTCYYQSTDGIIHSEKASQSDIQNLIFVFRKTGN